MDRELYDKICKVLTWYEHPEESPLDEKEVSEEMYSTLVEAHNAMCNEYGFYKVDSIILERTDHLE